MQLGRVQRLITADETTLTVSGTTLSIKNGGVSAAKVAADVATQAELDAKPASLFAGWSANLGTNGTSARVHNTAYQNTGSTARVVIVNHLIAGFNGTLQLATAATDSWAAPAARFDVDVASIPSGAMVIVPPGHWVKSLRVGGSGGPPTCPDWYELQL